MSNIMKIEELDLTELSKTFSLLEEQIEKISKYISYDSEFERPSREIKYSFSCALKAFESLIVETRRKYNEKNKWQNISKKLNCKIARDLMTEDELSELMSIVDCRANNE